MLRPERARGWLPMPTRLSDVVRAAALQRVLAEEKLLLAGPGGVGPGSPRGAIAARISPGRSMCRIDVSCVVYMLERQRSADRPLQLDNKSTGNLFAEGDECGAR
jgi:hypothetical protein